MTGDTGLLAQRAYTTRATLEALKRVVFPLQMPGVEALLDAQKTLVTLLEAKVLPHLELAQLPVIVVVGGSSGAGKSTIVNSVLGKEVSAASVLRPTTRVPTIVMYPLDEPVMRNHAIMKGAQVVVCEEALPGIVLVDAPDLDTVEVANHEFSRRLMEAADLWLFTTTATRYGDAVAWQALESATRRGVSCAVVLNRVPQRAQQVVQADLAARLATNDLTQVPVFSIADQGAMEGQLPALAVSQLRQWLLRMSQSRVVERVADASFLEVLPSVRADLLLLANGLDAQRAAMKALLEKTQQAMPVSVQEQITHIQEGRLGRGAPTVSWLSLASSGGVLASLVNAKSPKIWERGKTKRDHALLQLFSLIQDAVRLVLEQVLLHTQNSVEELWEHDIVVTNTFLRNARKGMDVADIVEQAMTRWQVALQVLSKDVAANAWLTSAGVTALLGVAAGGITGALKVAHKLGLSEQVEQAKELLGTIVEQTVMQVKARYEQALLEVQIPESTTLRLRATEFMDWK